MSWEKRIKIGVAGGLVSALIAASYAYLYTPAIPILGEWEVAGKLLIAVVTGGLVFGFAWFLTVLSLIMEQFSDMDL